MLLVAGTSHQLSLAYLSVIFVLTRFQEAGCAKPDSDWRRGKKNGEGASISRESKEEG